MALKNFLYPEKKYNPVLKLDNIFPDFTLMNSSDPIDTLKSYISDGYSNISATNNPKINFNNGTTTLAFIYNDGIIVSVDSRATAGNYIASQTVQKAIEINSHMIGTMAGGAADCQYWHRVLYKYCKIYEFTNNEKISVAAASKFLFNILMHYKGMGLSIGTMISGWDKKGPHVYFIDNSGTRLCNNFFSVGSGSVFAYSILDAEWKADLSKESAIELGKRAIYHATFRDAASGGSVTVYHINKDGHERIGTFDVNDLHYSYNPVK